MTLEIRALNITYKHSLFILYEKNWMYFPYLNNVEQWDTNCTIKKLHLTKCELKLSGNWEKYAKWML